MSSGQLAAMGAPSGGARGPIPARLIELADVWNAALPYLSTEELREICEHLEALENALLCPA